MYISTAVISVHEAELQEMLARFRRNNERDNITGMLLYSGEHYVQLIEGEEAALRKLYAKIEKDYLHTNIIKLADGQISHRLFKDWSMGFKGVTEAALTTLPGYINPASPVFLNQLPEPEESASSVLQQFVRNNMMCP
ncbi:BLUF domain-containing protein [Adhaeribacter swui]|uniref:BLUF domain-containing protein n=1 Tax=Adhaeribacter swui TaxID=2086471 RepID=A0A7G7G9C5_9BACT|nr:BLUF domain-containing protein [Adhaeribacter swui]QNF33759.1 BLUF domain-containing protein [Adhaeribacter swui]